jgi:hypothetical protein
VIVLLLANETTPNAWSPDVIIEPELRRMLLPLLRLAPNALNPCVLIDPEFVNVLLAPTARLMPCAKFPEVPIEPEFVYVPKELAFISNPYES